MSLVVLEVGLAAACAWLAWEVLPPRRAIRVRNAFLLRRGRAEDFAWTPSSRPADYRVETLRPPVAIERAVANAGVLALDDDWERARALVTMLVSHRRGEGAIRADLATSFRGILEGTGYCADYVRVYLAAAIAGGLFCRQWAFSFDGFGGHGHTFVEVFDRRRGVWSFLDVHNNVHAVCSGSPTPLSALKLRQAILNGVDVEFVRAGPGPLGFPHRGKLLDYYRRGAVDWYLWWGNDVITRDTTRLPQPIARRIGPLLHRVRSATGRLPQIVALATPENDPRIVAMERLRWRVAAAILVVVALAAGLLVSRVSAYLGLVGHG
jgi:hypothetical protein